MREQPKQETPRKPVQSRHFDTTPIALRDADRKACYGAR